MTETRCSRHTGPTWPIERARSTSQVVAKVEAQTKKPFAITLLSDSDHKVIDQYGLLNEAVAKRNRFLPHPTTYVIDPEGVVRWKFTKKDYKVRPTNQAILEALKAMRQRSR